MKTLFSEVKGKVNELKRQVIDKKDQLSALSKESDRLLTKYDEETEGMVQLIYKSRDKQVY